MVDSHIKIFTASLHGQSHLSWSSSLGSSSTPGVAGMADDKFTPKRLNMLSRNPFCAISNSLSSQSRLKAQLVPRRFAEVVRGEFLANAAWKSLPVSSEQCHIHEQPYSGLPCRPQSCENTRISPTLLHTVLFPGLYR